MKTLAINEHFCREIMVYKVLIFWVLCRDDSSALVETGSNESVYSKKSTRSEE